MVQTPHHLWPFVLVVSLQLCHGLLLPALGEVTKSCSNLLVQLERYSDQELLESCEARDPDFETT
ncbi:unnamed protein product [Cladocopium goreaui]|uniref:Uncharacterized protein n=1 Tax=Cladocopium goreaui TaxID=2562237 RepID=A0A9P1D0T0_9DINO|nr:unnamed protein product [Cladocopium goreaui]